jgi:hypothetical protein
MPQPNPDDCKITSTSLEDNHILHITAADNQNRTETASIDLDSIIGNVNGALSLGATNFSAKARNVKLSDDGTVLDADLPDDNGDYSTSSCSIQQEINTLDGQLALLFALGVPHSQVHADADTVKQADKELTKQVETVGDSQPVDALMTLHLDSSYDMKNTNAQWVKQNLGPQGVIGSAIHIGVTAVAVVGGTVKAAQENKCVIL